MSRPPPSARGKTRAYGFEPLLLEFNRQMEETTGKFRQGIIAGALELEAACTRSITEVLYSVPRPGSTYKRTGNLRASVFTLWSDNPDVPDNNKTATFHGKNGDDVKSSVGAAKDFTKQFLKDKKNSAVVGYGANYALAVHEGVEGKFDGYKWLERALRERTTAIVGKVRELVLGAR